MSAIVETITPNQASVWLENMGTQRLRKHSHVAYLAREMSSGRWQVNGETIIISSTGRVIDGQHRLAACIMCNKPFKSHVVYGIPDDCFSTIDTGAKRTAGDTFHVNGISSARNVSAGLAWFWKYSLARKRGGSLNMWDKPSSVELLKMAQDDLEFCVKAMSVSAKATKKYRIIPISMCFGLYTAFCKYDTEASADMFFNALISGAGLSINHPILVLGNKLGSLVGSNGVQKNATLKHQVIAAYFCIAYRKYINGEQLTFLRWTEGKDKFPFV